MTFIKRLHLADAISLSGLIFIWLSLVSILNDQAFQAIIYTLLAFSIDMLDGFVARRQQTASAFGLQLDTIIDTLNYPLFASFFTYYILLNQSHLGSLTALIILIFSSLRLSRMAHHGIQKDHQSKSYYEGVVTPHLLLAIILMYYIDNFILPVSEIISFLIISALSFLMISDIKIYKPTNYFGVIGITLTLLAISFYGLWLQGN